ncbi:MAG TPA: hypothetical protein VJX74_02890, partial [Blastocatellia bacterium]|nr:hypothetical protein [Blastocatellia bacterium]
FARDLQQEYARDQYYYDHKSYVFCRPSHLFSGVLQLEIRPPAIERISRALYRQPIAVKLSHLKMKKEEQIAPPFF